MRALGRRTAGAAGARVSGVAGGVPARVLRAPTRDAVSRFGHSGALLAQVRHFLGRFARFVQGTCAISPEGLSPGENDFGLLRETAADARRREQTAPLHRGSRRYREA